MTSNLDRAADVITETEIRIQGHEFDLPPDRPQAFSQALADAGLLMSDLPEPRIRSIEGYHASHPWAEWGDDAVTCANGHIRVAEHGEMSADEARELAVYLISAAEYTEENA